MLFACRAVDNAIQSLREIGGLEEGSASSSETPLKLSTLGKYLSMLPLDVRLSKMLIYGALFSCLEPILTIAAAISYKSPFLVSPGRPKTYLDPTYCSAEIGFVMRGLVGFESRIKQL